ncbi:hypothetical protein BURK1_03108 [Burkholderiales bacterium]|nr:hypothetical protein BURK1_03108 [Burkholderiales bacterium]
MLASLALPAHALPARASMGGVGGDLCVGGKVVPGTPASAGAVHACDACCGSSAAPPSAPPASGVVPAAHARIAAPTSPRCSAADVLAAPARAPPA